MLRNIKLTTKGKGKGKAVPLQVWKLRFPDLMTTAPEGGKVSLTQRPPLPPGNPPGTRFY